MLVFLMLAIRTADSSDNTVPYVPHDFPRVSPHLWYVRADPTRRDEGPPRSRIDPEAGRSRYLPLCPGVSGIALFASPSLALPVESVAVQEDPIIGVFASSSRSSVTDKVQEPKDLDAGSTTEIEVTLSTGSLATHPGKPHLP